jgi:hypothetical protein
MGERTYTWDHGQVPRPATGKTPVRNVRVADEIWKPALAKAKREKRPLTEVIVDCLKEYIADDAPPDEGE